MRNEPGQNSSTRHRQLKGPLATAVQGGKTLPQWQIEVTGGGRVWYVVDEERRTIWVRYASPKHPQETE